VLFRRLDKATSQQVILDASKNTQEGQQFGHKWRRGAEKDKATLV